MPRTNRAHAALGLARRARTLGAALCVGVLAIGASPESHSQQRDLVLSRITAYEQSYAASRHPALKFLLAEEYARIGERKRALEALQVIAASERGYLPPRYSPLWKYADEPEFTALFARLRAKAPSTSHGVVEYVLRGEKIVPEGMAFDERTQRLFVGDMRARRVYAVRRSGEIEPVVTDIALQPLGLCVDVERRRLWIATNNANTSATTPRSELLRVDLDTGERRVFSEPTAAALNDVATAPNGDVYTSDFGGGAVFQLRAETGRWTALLAPGTLSFPNGLAVDDAGRFLYVSQGLALVRVELATGALHRLSAPADLDTIGTDGLYYRGGALYGVQNLVTPGRVVRMHLAEGGARISGYDVLESRHPHFDTPTTAAFAGDKLLVLANAQIHRIGEDGGLDERGLKPIVVLGYDVSADVSR